MWYPKGYGNDAGWNKSSGVAAYQGPVDINGTALAWYGLRGSSLAYNTGSNPAIDVVDAATGLITTTVNIKTNGDLDTATILGLGYSVRVSKLYDQSGNGLHVINTTLSNMPSLITSSVPGLSSSKPAMQFSGTQALVCTANAILTQAQPYSASGVVEATTTSQGFYAGGANNSGFGFNINVANDAGFFSTNVLAVTSIPINNFYAKQMLANTTSSKLYINGSLTSGDAGTLALSSDGSLNIGSDSFARPLTGYLTEFGVWAGDKSANNSNVNSNQRGYWGF